MWYSLICLRYQIFPLPSFSRLEPSPQAPRATPENGDASVRYPEERVRPTAHSRGGRSFPLFSAKNSDAAIDGGWKLFADNTVDGNEHTLTSVRAPGRVFWFWDEIRRWCRRCDGGHQGLFVPLITAALFHSYILRHLRQQM